MMNVYIGKKKKKTRVKCILKGNMQGSPGGSGVKNLPTNAGDTGSTPNREDPTCCKATKSMSHNY